MCSIVPNNAAKIRRPAPSPLRGEGWGEGDASSPVLRMLACALLFALCGAIALAQGQLAPPKQVAVGDKAPDFTLKDRSGKQWKLSSLRGKKVVLMDFGRSMCIPCKSVAGDLQTLENEYSKKGLQIFAVNLDGRDLASLPALVDTYKLTYPILLDWKFDAARAYGVPVIPFLVLVDKKGVVRYTHIGYGQNFIQTFRSKIRPLLAEQATPPKAPAKKPAPRKASTKRK